MLLLLTIMIIADNNCNVNNNFGGYATVYNKDIREAAAASKIKLWQIADRLGISDGNFSRKLRKELPPEDKERILKIIGELAKEG